jgi:hypothetical protein
MCYSICSIKPVIKINVSGYVLVSRYMHLYYRHVNGTEGVDFKRVYTPAYHDDVDTLVSYR